MKQSQIQYSNIENTDNHWNSLYILGGITTIIALTGISIDIVISIITGGNLAALPPTAIERFAQFQENSLIGLYNLDLLNIMVQIILIPTYIALYATHRNVNKAYSILALIVFLFSSVIYGVQQYRFANA